MLCYVNCSVYCCAHDIGVQFLSSVAASSSMRCIPIAAGYFSPSIEMPTRYTASLCVFNGWTESSDGVEEVFMPSSSRCCSRRNFLGCELRSALETAPMWLLVSLWSHQHSDS